MDAGLTGDYIGLVAQLLPTDSGAWYLTIDGTIGAFSVPLMPVTLVIRLWRNDDTGTLRGTIGMLGSAQTASIQSSGYLTELVCTWLFGDIGSTPNT